MKKKINVVDFLQLTLEQREHLRDITNYTNLTLNKYYMKYKDGFGLTKGDHCISLKRKVRLLAMGNDVKIYPCFTIGDMEEILKEKFTFIKEEIDEYSHENWDITVGNVGMDNHMEYAIEKCDALWKQIKWCLKEGLI